jgi:hypothetical protein
MHNSSFPPETLNSLTDFRSEAVRLADWSSPPHHHHYTLLLYTEMFCRSAIVHIAVVVVHTKHE